ncbi:LysR family transcriptional regulator [Staphylococcus sp. ACRSN]|uniref:LysR family transcriptional regulator n=1 Tax=Staphylococcus sp. ACRSN TaxID=2918214 RepID=UPI001EF2DDE1|nr:LysR family transcriptional regulator [Staphylococcus sp. ACRSN]MCG7339916.1 LysR family transcriptional regulator [Staphylococcus sp. ACRSN]
MQIEDLKTFKKVCDLKSFTKAAIELNYVQSNVTAKIKRLEKYYDTQLLYRDKKEVTPTAKGHVLLSYINEILSLTTKAEADIGKVKDITLQIGSIETIAATRLPEILEAFRKEDKNTKLNVTTGSSKQLVEHIKNRNLDGAFLSGVVNEKEIIQVPLYEEKMVVISQKGSTDLLQNSLPQSIIVFEKGCFYRSYFEQWLKYNCISVQSIMTLNTLDGILGCVKAGIGIAMLPFSVIKNRADIDVDFYEMNEIFEDVPISFVYRRDNIGTPAFLQLLSILQDE